MVRSIFPALAALAVLVPCGAASQERPFLLDGFVITASPTPRPARDVARFVTVLEGQALRDAGVTTVVDALRGVPGLQVVRGGSFGAATSVFMRGGESDYVQVLVDGVQVNSPGGAFDFAGLLVADVERIEVVRGPASSLYGSDAMSGVIQVVTRRGRGVPRGEVALQGGSHGRRDASVSLGGGQGGAGWSLSLARQQADGLLPVNNHFGNTVLSAGVRLAPDDATRATVSLRMAERSYHFPTDGSGAVTDVNAFTFGDEASVSVGAARRVLTGLEVQAGVAVARTQTGTEDLADTPGDTLGYYGFNSLDHVQRSTADLRANVFRGPWVATVGVEVEVQEQRSFSESLSQWGPTSGRSDDRRDNVAAYAHLTGSRGPGSFAAGARLEDNERYGTFASWNAEGGWWVAPGLRARVAAGIGVKEPTFYETFASGWVRGNPALDPERARSLEAGVEQGMAAGAVTVRLTAFTQRFRDLIQYLASPAAGDPNFVNVAEAESRGLEVGAELRVGRLEAGADWSWLRTRVIDAGVDEGPDADFVEGGRLLRRPDHTVRGHAALSLDPVRVTGDVRVVGARDDRDYSGWPAKRVVLPRYTTLDLGLEMPLGERLRVSLRADNLLDARYEEVQGYPAPGRSLAVGGRVSLGAR
jgi:vitamin B12 transporter